MTATDYRNLSKIKRAAFVKKQLEVDYPIVETPLKHSNVFELLVAVILSAQTKDETTNLVTPNLFKLYPSVSHLSLANPEDLEPIIRLVNYYKTKSKHLIKMAQKLILDFGGEVPYTIDELTTLPGVGRKTANVVISEWFARHPHPNPKLRAQGKKVLAEGFVVDTHVLRVSRNLLLTKNTSPQKVEQDLMKLFKREDWPEMSLRLIFHGRNIDRARNPLWMQHKVWSKVYS